MGEDGAVPLRALVIGEALIDITRTGEAVLGRHPGGAAANVALGLGRLGRPVDLATHLGEDPDGDAVRRPLEEAAVAVLPVHRYRARPTFTADAFLDADGAATYAFDIDWDIDVSRLPTEPGVAHTGCLGATLLPGAETVLRFLTSISDRATISYDVNVRPAAVEPVADARDRIDAFVGLSDVVKASDEDIAWFAPDRAVERTARQWASGGTAVIVTRGAAGATLFRGAERLDVAAVPVEVVDTIGAGDAYCAGLIDALWEFGVLGGDAGRDAFAGLTTAQWRRAMTAAASIASITVTRPGANPPWRNTKGDQY